MRDSAARAVCEALASGSLSGGASGLHLVGMEDTADEPSEGCVLGHAAQCMLHECPEDCDAQGAHHEGVHHKGAHYEAGGMNPYVAAQAAARYAVSVFGDELAVKDLINASVAASRLWDRPPPPRPFVDIGYGAVPYYVSTPLQPPGQAHGGGEAGSWRSRQAHGGGEEEEEDGKGDAAMLLRLIEDGLQWSLKWSLCERDDDVQGGEGIAATLARVREGLMLSLPTDLLAFSIPLPC